MPHKDPSNPSLLDVASGDAVKIKTANLNDFVQKKGLIEAALHRAQNQPPGSTDMFGLTFGLNF